MACVNALHGRDGWKIEVENAVHDAIVMRTLEFKCYARDHQLCGAVAQEGTGKVKPWAIRVVQRYCWHVEGQERDAGDDLVPVKADPEEALKRAWGRKVLDEGERMWRMPSTK